MKPTSLFIMLVMALPIGAQTANPQVVFSEIMWMGSSASSADEWIELYNAGETRQDLSQWTLTRLTSEGEQVMLAIDSGQINPGATFLIANYKADHTNSRLASPPQLVDAALSLPNNKLQLRLYSGLPDSGARLMDTADDGSGAPLAGDAEQKRSMVRIKLDGDGTKAESWATAEQASGWDAESIEMGTPGSIPSHLLATASSETAVQTTNWATLKQP
jgi:hypothetical protein